MTRIATFYRMLLGRPRLVAAALVVLTAFALWQATHLRVAVDLSGLIGEQTDGAQAMRAYERRFAPLRAEEVFLVEADSFAEPRALDALLDLVFELQLVDGVERIISIASIPAPGREGPWLTGPELAELEPRARLELMRSSDPLAAQLMSPDLGAAVIVAAPHTGRAGNAFADALDEAAAEVGGLRVTNVGLLAVQRAIAAELIHDLRLLVPAAVLVCLVLSWLLFRSVRAVIAISLPPIVGLVWFLGWMGLSGTPLDPVMGALPVLLIVLSFSDSIHVFHSAQHRVHAQGQGGDAARVIDGVVETAPAAILTSLTTIIAFASLILPASPSLNAMSGAGIVGMILCLLAVLSLTPVLMLLLKTPRRDQRVPEPFAIVVPVASRALSRPTWVAVATLVVLGVFWALQSQSQIGFRYADYLPRGAEVSEALARMDRQSMGSDRMLVIVEDDPAAPGDNVRRAAETLYGNVGGVWATGPAGASMLPRMASEDGSAHALPMNLPIAARDIRADQVLADVETRLNEAGLADATQIIGPGHALLTEGPRIVQSLRLGLYGTILVITVLVALVFRSWRLALAALVVNVIPILGVEAWLVLIGRELTIMNVIALTVAFGIAVDDTLHFLNRLRLAPQPEMADRVVHALREAGPPIVSTTVILMAGLVVTLMSALPGLAIYGGLIALAVVFALLADLFLLPGLIRWSFR